VAGDRELYLAMHVSSADNHDVSFSLLQIHLHSIHPLGILTFNYLRNQIEQNEMT
jgi:hypothetical protein